jgi:hypothetical protein
MTSSAALLLSETRTSADCSLSDNRQGSCPHRNRPQDTKTARKTTVLTTPATEKVLTAGSGRGRERPRFWAGCAAQKPASVASRLAPSGSLPPTRKRD